jgi:hypothetical protein
VCGLMSSAKGCWWLYLCSWDAEQLSAAAAGSGCCRRQPQLPAASILCVAANSLAPC